MRLKEGLERAERQGLTVATWPGLCLVLLGVTACEVRESQGGGGESGAGVFIPHSEICGTSAVFGCIAYYLMGGPLRDSEAPHVCGACKGCRWVLDLVPEGGWT